MTTISFPIEIKKLGAREFEGYGSVFGNVDHGGDVVVRGAFARSLAEHKSACTMPLMLWMHQADQVPGVWHDMKEDDSGLHVHGELVDTQLGNDVHKLLQKKAVRGLSIGYRPRDVDYDRDGNRLLKDVELWETSIVSMAMNPLARIAAVKSRLSYDGEYVPLPRELERIFKDAGCSQSVSKRLVARVLDTTPDATPGAHREGGEVDEEAKVAEAILNRLNSLSLEASTADSVARLQNLFK